MTKTTDDPTYTLSIYRGSSTGRITEGQVQEALSPADALVRITHAGLCGTDKVFLRSPHQTLGHEGIGYIEAVGNAVTNLPLGTRVGIGYIQRICGECEHCSSGRDQYCTTKSFYGSPGNNRGCFANQVVWDASMLIPIPAEMESGIAASLMCGGATAWTVLTRFGMRAGERVGVLGIGGLGHLAIMMGVRMGYEVVAISGSEGKRKDCLEMGAGEFWTVDEVEGMKPLKHLLLCGSGKEDYGKLIECMAIYGTIYPLPVSFTPAEIPVLRMIDKGLRIQGSLVASRRDITEMLQFCARQQIAPVIRQFPLTQDGLEEALGELEKQRIQYKGVLIAEKPHL